MPRLLSPTHTLLACWLLILQALAMPAAAAEKPAEPRLELFSPVGEMRTVRQVQVRFNADMVRFGDPRLPDPFTADCAAAGHGRWVDSRNWVWDFEDDLPSGLACRFAPVGVLKTVDGKTVRTEAEYRFNTGGPMISDSLPRAGISYSIEAQVFLVKRHNELGLAIEPADRGIAEGQRFMLKLDGALDEQTVERNAYCLVQGLNEQIPLRRLSEAETEAYVSRLNEWEREWWDSVEAGYWQEVRRKPVSKLIVACQRRFPNEAKVTLVWGRNIAAPTGLANNQEQLLGYQVRPEFTARFSCSRESARKPCNPLTDMSLEFTEEVSAETLQNIQLLAGGKVWRPEPNYDGDSWSDGSYVNFRGPFPINTDFSLVLPPGVKGLGSERPLKNAARFPLVVKTGGYPPLAKFAADFGIVERAVGAVPLTLRNLEPGKPGAADTTAARLRTLRLPDDDTGLIAWLKKAEQFDARPWGAARLPPKPGPGEPVDNTPPPPDPRGESLILNQPGVTVTPLPKPLGAKAFEVVGIPVPAPGMYLHEVESRYLGNTLLAQDQPMYVHSLSLVTDLAVHLKRGTVNSLVWVTSLGKAQPVAGARVEVHDCADGRLLWQGDTDPQGIARIDARLPEPARSEWTNDSGEQNLKQLQSCRGASMLVSARKDGDRGFVLSNWNEGIEPWRYDLHDFYGTDDAEKRSAHTVFDRSLLRPGETVHMRHFLRARSLTGFGLPSVLPDKVEIRHLGSDDRYELSPSFDSGGNADSVWKIPTAAKLGSYAVSLHFPDDSTLSTGEFRVAHYRLPLLKARLQLPPGPLAFQETVPADMSLGYLNGGAYPSAPVTLRGRIEEAWVNFPDYDRYSFRTCVGPEGEDLCPPFSNFEAPETVDDKASTLDEHGGGREAVTLSPRVNPSALRLEMEFRDPSGETQTVAAATQYWPGEWLPGIKLDSWLQPDKQQQVPVELVVLDTKGRPVTGAPVNVAVFLLETVTTREKSMGGLYHYNSTQELKPLPQGCRGRTDRVGRLQCRIRVTASGNLRLRAIVTDRAGRQATASAEAWVTRKRGWWFDQQDTDRIDLIPEKKAYNPGDTMRLQVRMPFREALALVTTEREGILDASVQRLSGNSPVIRAPVLGGYAPNVFVSALVVRGRNDAVQPTAFIDLGKPAFKLGLTEVKVGHDAFRLDVSVRSDRPRYRIRDTAKVQVQVKTPDGKTPPAGTEVMFAVVDEALLELAPNHSWELLQAMMGERGLQVETATSQLQVVGKRHFGRKAVPAGGGGGRGSTRELFDTLVYWQARATVDTDGRASFSFPLNDSLSGFRLVAVASSADRFGKGEGRLETFQDLQVISGLSPLVREGDRFQAEFTVRNAADVEQTIRFEATASATGITPLQRELTLAPGKSQTLSFPVEVPPGIGAIDWTVSAASALANDRMKFHQTVLDPVPEQVVQATLTRLPPGEDYTLPVAKPADALSGGGIRVQLRPHLAEGMDGVQRYFREYRYACLEQQVSRAIALQDESAWQGLGENLPAFLDRNGFAKLFTPLDQGDPLITAYLLELVHESGRHFPDDSQQRMLAALQGFAEGKLKPEVWNFGQFDDDARRLKAMSVLARYQRFEPSTLGSLTVQPSLWPTAMVLDWVTLLQARPDLPDQAQRLAEASGILRSRLNLQGTALMLSRNESNQWWLYSSADAAAVRLFLAAQTLPGWQDDLPRLIRGLSLRQAGGHWDTTLANAWGLVATRRFSERFESEPVTGKTRLALDKQVQQADWSAGTPAARTLDWPAAPATFRARQLGGGAPWLTVQSVARIPVKTPWNTGYAITKSLLPLQQKTPGQWSVGDVAVVLLDVEAQTDMGWVVMDDPVPAGASLLGRGLDRDSGLLTEQAERFASWSGHWRTPDFAEYKQDGYRGYYARMGKGHTGTSYIVRFNQAGTFHLPPTRVEAMYAPEMFGLLPNDDVVVQP